MGSERWRVWKARSRNAWEDSTAPGNYPVSGPQSVPLHGPQNQSPSLNIIGSSQTGQFGTFSRGIARSTSRSRSLSYSSAIALPVLLDPNPQRLFGAFPGRHTDEFQFSIDNGRRRGADRMPVGKLL